MITIYNVITNGGDGSNGVQWVMNPKVLDRMEELAEEGDETYSSGEGLQLSTLLFPDTFDLTSWLSLNNISLVTIEDMLDEAVPEEDEDEDD